MLIQKKKWPLKRRNWASLSKQIGKMKKVYIQPYDYTLSQPEIK
jgi:hypothetical protein